jgi:hypothetical protein
MASAHVRQLSGVPFSSSCAVTDAAVSVAFGVQFSSMTRDRVVGTQWTPPPTPYTFVPAGHLAMVVFIAVESPGQGP